MVLVNKWYLLVKNGPHVGLSGSSWKQFRDAGGSHAARVPAAPTRPLGLLLTASSTSSPPSCGHCFPSPHQPSACYARDMKGQSQQKFCCGNWRGIQVQRPGVWIPTGKTMPCSCFSSLFSVKDPERSGASKCGPHQLAEVSLGVLRFLHQHDQKTGGTGVVLASGFTPVSSRCP